MVGKKASAKQFYAIYLQSVRTFRYTQHLFCGYLISLSHLIRRKKRTLKIEKAKNDYPFCLKKFLYKRSDFCYFDESDNSIDFAGEAEAAAAFEKDD